MDAIGFEYSRYNYAGNYRDRNRLESSLTQEDSRAMRQDGEALPPDASLPTLIRLYSWNDIGIRWRTAITIMSTRDATITHRRSQFTTYNWRTAPTVTLPLNCPIKTKGNLTCSHFGTTCTLLSPRYIRTETVGSDNVLPSILRRDKNYSQLQYLQ